MLPKDVKRSRKKHLHKKCTCFISKKITWSLFPDDYKKIHSKKLQLDQSYEVITNKTVFKKTTTISFKF